MATMNFSVPEEVKKQFDKAFAREGPISPPHWRQPPMWSRTPLNPCLLNSLGRHPWSLLTDG